MTHNSLRRWLLGLAAFVSLSASNAFGFSLPTVGFENQGGCYLVIGSLRIPIQRGSYCLTQTPTAPAATPARFTRLSGTVSGLNPGEFVRLVLNNRFVITVGENGRYRFPQTLAYGESYRVFPFARGRDGMVCDALNRTGTSRGTDISNIHIRCRHLNEQMVFDETTVNRVFFEQRDIVDWMNDLAEMAVDGFSAEYSGLQPYCRDGSLTRNLEDADADGELSGGDTLTLDYSNCEFTDVSGPVTGTLTFEVADVFVTRSGAGTLNGAVSVDGFEMGSDSYSGAFMLEYRHSTAFERVNIRTTQAMNIARRFGSPTTIERFRWVRQATEGNVTRYLSNSIRSGSTVGVYRCDGSLVSAGEREPLTGNSFVCRSNAPSAARYSGNPFDRIDVDTRGNGNWVRQTSGIVWRSQRNFGGGFFKPQLRPAEIASRIELDATWVFAPPSADQVFVVGTSQITRLQNDLSVIDNLALTNNPLAAALSDDGTTLYVSYSDVGEVESFSMPALTSNGRFSLGTDSDGDTLFGTGLAPLPGMSGSVAVASDQEVHLFDDGTRRAVTYIPEFNEPNVTHLLFTRAGSLYGYDATTSSSPVTELLVSADGVRQGQIWEPGLSSFGGRLFESADGIASNGRLVVDFENDLVTGTLEFSSIFSFEPVNFSVYDLDRNRVYLASDNRIGVLDAQRKTPLGDYTLDLARNASIHGTVSNGTLFLADATQLVALRTAALEEFDARPCTTVALSEFITTTGAMRLDCPTTDMVYLSSLDRLYVAVTSDAGSNGNSIFVVEPDTLAIEEIIPVGSSPTSLALTPGEDIIYVGLSHQNVVAELDVRTSNIQLLTGLRNPDSLLQFADYIDAAPNFDDLALIASGTDSIGNPDRTFLLTGGTIEESSPSRYSGGKLVFAPGRSDQAFRLSAGGTLAEYAVSPTSVTLVSQDFRTLDGWAMVRAGSYFYTNYGERYDPATGTVARYPVGQASENIVGVNVDGGLVFLRNQPPGEPTGISVFDELTRNLVTHWIVPRYLNTSWRGQIEANHPGRLIWRDEDGVVSIPIDEVIPP